MPYKNLHPHFILKQVISFLLIMIACLSLLVITGCGKKHDTQGDINLLVIERFRVLEDEDEQTVRVLAELKNTGKTVVKKAQVTAKLHGEQGQEMGRASIIVENIVPAEPQIVSFVITTQPGKAEVEFLITQPEKTAVKGEDS